MKISRMCIFRFLQKADLVNVSPNIQHIAADLVWFAWRVLLCLVCCVLACLACFLTCLVCCIAVRGERKQENKRNKIVSSTIELRVASFAPGYRLPLPLARSTLRGHVP